MFDSEFAWSSLGAVAALGIAGTGLALFAMTTLVGRVGATRGSAVTYTFPIVAILLGVLFRDEKLHLIAIVGTVLVIVGAYIVSRAERGTPASNGAVRQGRTKRPAAACSVRQGRTARRPAVAGRRTVPAVRQPRPRCRGQAGVVEPVEQIAVVFGESDDRRTVTDGQLVERTEVAVLGLFLLGVDRPAVRATLGVPESLGGALDHVVGERRAQDVCLFVGLGRGVAQKCGQEALDQPVATDHVFGGLLARLGQDCLFALTALHQALVLEALHHLADGRLGHAQHLGDACRKRRLITDHRPILAHGKSQEVDRLEVVVDRVAVDAHRERIYPWSATTPAGMAGSVSSAP